MPKITIEYLMDIVGVSVAAPDKVIRISAQAEICRV